MMPCPKVFFRIAASVTAPAFVSAVNPNGTKTLLANGVSTFFTNGKPTEINGFRMYFFGSSFQ